MKGLIILSIEAFSTSYVFSNPPTYPKMKASLIDDSENNPANRPFIPYYTGW